MTKDLKMFNSDRGTATIESIRLNVETIKQVFTNVYNDLVSIEAIMGDQISSDQIFIITGLKDSSHYLKLKINGYENKILLFDHGQEYLANADKVIDLNLELKNLEEDVNAFLAGVLTLFTLFELSPVSINLQ